MELIVISHTKIKIMLTKPDMARYELATSNIDSADEHTRCAIRHILADADEQVGFDTEGQRLFVQFFASKDGGCEIFVTKLGNNTDTCQQIEAREERLLACVRECEFGNSFDETEDSMPLIKSEATSISPRMDTTSLLSVENISVTVFVEELSVLLSLCRRLLGAGFSGCSEAYMHESKKGFYLRLNESHRAHPSQDYPFVGEYGVVLANTAWDLYIDEHARILCPSSAVQTLGVL
jgi:negative regulator of genetic competence, sporulation and motility